MLFLNNWEDMNWEDITNHPVYIAKANLTGYIANVYIANTAKYTIQLKM